MDSAIALSLKNGFFSTVHIVTK